MPSKITVYDLEHVTDYFGFEHFCNDLMSREGYRSIQPLGGHKDKGRDAIHYDVSTGIRTVLAYSVRKDWEEKLKEDLETVKKHGHECDRFLFATTERIHPGDFDDAKAAIRERYGWHFELYDLYRISTLVDSHHQDLRELHSNIFPISSKVVATSEGRRFDPNRYVTYLLAAYELWVDQYTPLLAEHRELDTFVDLRGGADSAVRLPVADIADHAQLSILLGESGAGKTTSLWKIVVEASRRLRSGSSAAVPTLFNLRGWGDRKCRDLLQDQFDILEIDRLEVEELLSKGSLLVLIDGINEVVSADLSDCAYDVASFIASYPSNRFVISCRSADFRPTLLPTKDVKPPLKDPYVYEICRLERDQIEGYVATYCARHSMSRADFLGRLRIRSDAAWEESSAALQLARIPLYLQIFLDVFRKTGDLPTTKAELLRSLVDQILDREESRRYDGIDRFANEELLGCLAFRSAENYSLRIEESYTRELLSEALEALRTKNAVPHDTVLGDAWRKILSTNFLKQVDRRSVEWLHQLIRDYFLGTEYARIWRSKNGAALDVLKQKLGGPGADIASTIALGFLQKRDAASFLMHLIDLSDENARRAFEGQRTDARVDVVGALVTQILSTGDHETRNLKKISCTLPYREVAEALDAGFGETPDVAMRALVIEALAELIMEYLPRIAAYDERAAAGIIPFGPSFVDSALREARYQMTKAAIKTAERLLKKYLKDTNEIISFYAVKGLWESDRTGAIHQLKKLSASKSRQVVLMVNDLIEQWGIC